MSTVVKPTSSRFWTCGTTPQSAPLGAVQRCHSSNFISESSEEGPDGGGVDGVLALCGERRGGAGLDARCPAPPPGLPVSSFFPFIPPRPQGWRLHNSTCTFQLHPDAEPPRLPSPDSRLPVTDAGLSGRPGSSGVPHTTPACSTERRSSRRPVHGAGAFSGWWERDWTRARHWMVAVGSEDSGNSPLHLWLTPAGFVRFSMWLPGTA